MRLDGWLAGWLVGCLLGQLTGGDVAWMDAHWIDLA